MKKDLISKYKNKIFTKLQGCYLRSCKYYLKPAREKIDGLSVSNSGWNLKRKLLADIKADICGCSRMAQASDLKSAGAITSNLGVRISPPAPLIKYKE